MTLGMIFVLFLPRVTQEQMFVGAKEANLILNDLFPPWKLYF